MARKIQVRRCALVLAAFLMFSIGALTSKVIYLNSITSVSKLTSSEADNGRTWNRLVDMSLHDEEELYKSYEPMASNAPARVVESPMPENVIISTQRAKEALQLKLKELEFHKLVKKYQLHKPCNLQNRTAVPCNDTACTKHLSEDLEARLASLLSLTEHARKTLVNPLLALTSDLPPSHMTFVTAASANHFLESQAMLQTLHENVLPRIQNYSIYFYDMGLQESQLQQLKCHCKCTVLKFPFNLLSDAISNIRCYVWKPLIVQAHLVKTNTLVWLDASVRLHSNQSHCLFEKLPETGFLSSLSNIYVRPVAQDTVQEMFDFFQIQPCSIANFQELEASFLAFHNEPLISDVLVASWVACALHPDCMCPAGSMDKLDCPGGLVKYAKCHRFDQSAISILLITLFGDKYSTFIFDHTLYDVKRGHKAKYFDALDASQNLNS